MVLMLRTLVSLQFSVIIFNLLVTHTALMYQVVDLSSELICIHDTARPLVLAGDIEKVCSLAKCPFLFSSSW